MNYPEAAIRRALFYVGALALLLGVAQVGIIARRVNRTTAFDPASDISWSLLITLGVLLVLLLAFAAVLVRARKLSRAESEIWLTSGLDRQVFEQAPGGMLLSSADGRVRAVNAAYSRLTGFTGFELLGRFESFQHAGSLADAGLDEMNAHLHAHGVWKGEVWVRKPSGEALGFKVSRIALRDGEGSVQALLTLCQETSVSDEAQRLMLWQAHHDTLTKLPNRNLFQERLSRFLVTQTAAIAASQTSTADAQKPVSGGVLSIDLDGFGNVNDSMGFSAGDQVLMEAGHRVAMAVRETDTVARLGSNQFAVLLEGVVGDEELGALASSVVEKMSLPFVVRERELYVTASVGVLGLDGLASSAALSPGEVMQRADSARAQAEQSGGNRFMFFEPAMNERAQARQELETGLRHALPESQLELYYQPLVDQRAGKVVSFEALLRWHHPELGFVPPVQFIPLAEDTGLIVDIGIWIVEQAHERLQQWAEEGFSELRLSINISMRQLRDTGGVNRLIAALRAPETRRLTLEITESLLVADKDLYRDFLSQARGLGAKIALDDFGTGYSSLSYLRDYRFDLLKIDRAFVTGLCPQADEAAVVRRDVAADRNLVAVIVSLGQILDMEVVAEGVEHLEELSVLDSLGCALIQGYYFAKPMTADVALAYLRSARDTGNLRAIEQGHKNAAALAGSNWRNRVGNWICERLWWRAESLPRTIS